MTGISASWTPVAAAVTVVLAKTRQLTWIGTGNTLESTVTCRAAQGWQPITVTKGDAAGQGSACAGSELYGNPQRNHLGFVLSYGNSHEGVTGLSAESVCSATPEPANAAYLGWANGDGSEVIGSQVCGGHVRFGLFHGAAFTPLPALPTSVPTGSGVMIGTDAW
ncbi:MAG: hypothetical protein ACRDNS_12495 [Trebonia sp.]